MLKLIKVSITLAGLIALAYFVFMVPLGEKTFYEHITQISKTPEAQELGSELKKKVETAGFNIKRRLDGALDTAASSDTFDKEVSPKAPKTAEVEVTKEDRRALKELLEGLEKKQK